MIRTSFPKGYTVSVEHQSLEKPKNYKRDKHVFFLHKVEYGGIEEPNKKTIHSFEVSILVGFMLFFLALLTLCFFITVRST